MIESPRMDDEIIYSWYFNSVECFDSTSSTKINVLVEIMESLSSLRSHQNLTLIHTSPLCLILKHLIAQKPRLNESNDNLLEAFKKVTIIIPLIDAIKHILSYAKFLKGICTPHRNPRKIQLSETVSSIMMNFIPIKKRDPRAPMIMSEIGGMSFTTSFLDTVVSINILLKFVFDLHHVGELQPFLVELCLADGSVRKPHSIVEYVIIKIEDYYFPVDFLVVDMKTTKELSQAPIILGRPF